MEHTISKILETAIRINSQIIEAYLIEEQENSGYSAQVFFGMLKDEIQWVRKKYRTKSEKYEWIKEFDDILPVIEKNDLGNFFSDFDSRIEQFELVSTIVNDFFNQWLPKSENTPFIKKKQNPPSPTLENSFNKMSIKEVRAIFMPLVETKNKNGEYWMNKKDFDVFIRRSFTGESLAKPNINFNETEKGCIIKLFYAFYTESKKKREITSRLKKRYIELLEDAFNTEVFLNLHSANFCSRAKCDWLIN
jgi:hypothetical protein